MQAPMCRICKERHYGMCKGIGKTVKSAVRIEHEPIVTKSNVPVTKSKPIENVTLKTSQCGRGGKRPGAGRPGVHASHAARQKAYLARQADKAGNQ